MQQTRHHILEIIKRRGQATVEDIVHDLRQRRGDITAVTVRHHLDRLQKEALISAPELRRRSSPGRPQYVYSLTDKANDYFPNNYQRLSEALLQELRRRLPPEGVNVIMEGVADQLVTDVCIPDLPFAQRVEWAVEYLNNHGYQARTEQTDDGLLLHTENCPYHGLVSAANTGLCDMDMRLIATLLGVAPRRMSHMVDGSTACSYLIPLS